MKISEDLLAQFNDQITLEFSASTVYRQLAISAESDDLPGMAQWLRRQADEEIVHANKFIDHVLARDAVPQIGAVAAPNPLKDAEPLEIFEAALAHEQKVSESIRNLYRACDEAGDLDSRPLLMWFVDEQLEEESTVSEIIGRLKRIGDNGQGILQLDAELGKRPEGGTEPVGE
ncbi:pyruvate dehydrogenase [Platysternon megacephalum]|uniref:Ferritin n=1 Tax=Platysternon megacephalum TaxID=55544 RepID=A0A4D9DGD5_9SAUR|nr:pyruvate dehydrogenase [Platysternon megacephalum]